MRTPSSHPKHICYIGAGKYFNQEGSFCGANSHVYKDWGWSDFYAICKEVLYYNYPVNDNGVMRNFGNASTDYMTSVLGNHSVTWLSQAVASGQPFFAYMAPHAPHLPAIPAPWYADVPMPAQAPRTPNWNADVTGKHWAVASNDPMTAETIAGSDLLYGNRLRTLLSVDDWLQEVFSILETTGAINNTVIIYTSDHGYHTGQFRIWGEKSQPWVTDFRIPFYARAPGMTGNTSLPALVTNLDVPSTILELAGVQPAGGRTVDGKSFARFLAPATATATATAASTAPAPAAADIGADATSAGWRDRLLVEFEGYPLQYLRTCDSVYGTQACTPQSQEVLIDAESNTYAALRILNDTSNWVYVEYRPPGSPLAPASTNWTEAYNLSADPWQMSNLWPSGAPASLLQQLSKELWQLAACSGASCP